MPLPYYKVKQSVWIGDKKEDRYKAKLLNQEQVDIVEMAKRINKGGSLSEGETVGILSMLEEVLVEKLTDNFRVKLDCGTFAPTVKAKAVKSFDDLDASTIIRKRIRFTPSVDLKQTLANTGVQFVDLNKVRHL